MQDEIGITVEVDVTEDPDEADDDELAILLPLDTVLEEPDEPDEELLEVDVDVDVLVSPLP
jgi:hypothetical protein